MLPAGYRVEKWKGIAQCILEKSKWSRLYLHEQNNIQILGWKEKSHSQYTETNIWTFETQFWKLMYVAYLQCDVICSFSYACWDFWHNHHWRKIWNDVVQTRVGNNVRSLMCSVMWSTTWHLSINVHLPLFIISHCYNMFLNPADQVWELPIRANNSTKMYLRVF